MSNADRAKIFMPFDALTGFGRAIHDAEKEYIPRKILSEDVKEELDFKLKNLSIGELLSITYYTGSDYTKVTGVLTDISFKTRSLTLDENLICFKDISDISAL
ncbi:MAG: YolD-like family protein [Lachnospiraceae bacterium]|nr:YolD-like family protein [Lachnospiraceae bacterium]